MVSSLLYWQYHGVDSRFELHNLMALTSFAFFFAAFDDRLGRGPGERAHTTLSPPHVPPVGACRETNAHMHD
jgi:hypothetical protein